MADPRIDALIAGNAAFAETWSAPPTMVQLRETAKDQYEPVLIVTCMDPRVVPEQFLGPNQRIAVYRNGGGRVGPDVVRTVCILQSIAYKAERVHVVVVHHTDCGGTHISNDSIRADLHARGANGNSDIDFGTFRAEDLEKTVVDDMAYLRGEPLLQNVAVRGFVLDIDSGLLREVR